MFDIASLSAVQVVLIFVCASVIHYYGRAAIRPGGTPMAPGPKGWPLVGNMLDMPPFFHFLKYSEWSKQYGPIMTVNLLGRTVIVISSLKLVSELADKRHMSYSERPRFPMVTDLVGWDQLTVFMPPNPLWKEHRKNFNKLFGTKATVANFSGIEIFEARRFVRNFLREPTKIADHVRYWAGALALKVSYGYDTKTGHDDLVELVDEAMEQFTLLTKPGVFMVDFFPWLKHIPEWFPGAGFQRTAKYYKNTLTDMINVPFNIVQRQMKAGSAQQSFTANLLNAEDYTGDKEYGVKTSAATIYAAGADTTSGQVHGFLLILMLWPNVQKKAQEEIDQVVGSDRLPDFNDRDNLPYVEACVKEAMRLHTLVPTGGTRVVLKDDVLNGYFIPKGAVIQPCIWEMMHDPEVYPDPFNFVPERWLGKNPPPLPREMMFGFGRRICPGSILAEASIWIAAVMFLALFDIKPTKGSPTSFDQSMNGVLDGQPICHPKPFKSDIRPRNAKTETLILSIDQEL